jgi:hypothetical protein
MLLVALLLVGCADAESSAPSTTDAPTTTATTTSTTTTAVTTTTLDPAIARQQAYFLINTPFNVAVEEMNERTKGKTSASLSAFKELCAFMAPLEEKVAAELRAYPGWGDAQDEVDALASASAAASGLYYQCSRATSRDQAEAIDLQLQIEVAKGTAAASTVRSALGLPIDR